MTAAELRYGAIHRGWGEARMLKLDSKIQRAEVVHTGPKLVAICAQLRADCAAIGHALAQREHNADRWIAATAIRLGIPLVSNNTIFKAVPGLALVKRPQPNGSAASLLVRLLADYCAVEVAASASHGRDVTVSDEWDWAVSHQRDAANRRCGSGSV
jgi:predicted nucleic acid-binding protein